MFQQAIKIDCLISAIFQSFYQFVSYIFGKLALPSPSKHLFHKMFKIILLSIPMCQTFPTILTILFFFVWYRKMVSPQNGNTRTGRPLPPLVTPQRLNVF